jgi:dimethylaniline monooxygenase (N-oxide forming)
MNLLVSFTRYTTISDFPCSAEAPDFLSANEYCAYLEAYVTQFELWKPIHLSTRVMSIRRHSGGHAVTYNRPSGSVEE